MALSPESFTNRVIEVVFTESKPAEMTATAVSELPRRADEGKTSPKMGAKTLTRGVPVAPESNRFAKIVKVVGALSWRDLAVGDIGCPRNLLGALSIVPKVAAVLFRVLVALTHDADLRS